VNPGRELDALIAEKVMGLEICKCDHEALYRKHMQDLEDRRKDPYQIHHDYGYFSHDSDKKCNICTKLYIPVVNYSTNIATAWEVVEKLGNIEIRTYFKCEPKMVEVLLPVRKDKPLLFTVGKTAPHAICLAALKAVGVEI
jgi:hypothetical protein